jgi:predicted dehydrogenase
MTADRFRVVILGSGNVAEVTHVPVLRAEADRVDLVAAVDIDAGRVRAFCDRTEIPNAYTSVGEMLEAERPDLVDVCTPPATHVDLVIRCLEAGAWVLVEKPPTLSLAEYDRIEAAESVGGPYASVVFQHRFGSAGKHAAELIRAGELGRPLVALCNTVWYRPQEYFDVPWHGTWAAAGGGPTFGLGIHQMDLLLAMLGNWSEVSAVAGRLARVLETEDVSMAVARFENGAMASIVNSVLSPRQESYLRVDLSDATVEVSHLYGYGNKDWTYTPAPHVTDESRIERWRTPDGDEPSSHRPQVRALLDAMKRGERPPMSGAQGRQGLELVTGIYQSAFTGRPVRRSEITPFSPFYQSLNGGTPGWALGTEPPLAEPPLAEPRRAEPPRDVESRA